MPRELKCNVVLVRGVVCHSVLAKSGGPFFDVFLVPLLDGILVVLCAKVVPKRGLLGAILETSLGPV